MDREVNLGHSRRSFLANSGIGASVLALNPLLAASNTAAATEASAGKYDFETPYNRRGTDSTKWDQPIRLDHIDHIVAGMGIADMDFKCAPAITAALKKRIEHENWGYVDFGSSGPAAFRQGIIDWNKRRYGIDVISTKNLDITTGVHAGISAALRAFAPAGTKVLMTTPIYNGFYRDLMRGRLLTNDSVMQKVNGRYEIDWDDLERRMTPDTKVTILCNPHNPSGRVWSKADLNRYGELCLKHNVVMLVDEIHCDFMSKGEKYTPISTLDNKDIVNNSITFKSGSKSFSLAGMKCAWYFSTNQEMFNQVATYNYLDLNTMGMLAEQAAYAGGEGWLNECVDYIDGNQEFANRYIKSNIPMIKVGSKPESTYVAWLDVSAVSERIGAQKLADEENKKPQPIDIITGKPQIVTPEDAVSHWFATKAFVALNSGSGYGTGGHNHMRMNLATSRRTLKAALHSMTGALKSLA